MEYIISTVLSNFPNGERVNLCRALSFFHGCCLFSRVKSRYYVHYTYSSQCPSAHNICTMLNIRLNLVHTADSCVRSSRHRHCRRRRRRFFCCSSFRRHFCCCFILSSFVTLSTFIPIRCANVRIHWILFYILLFFLLLLFFRFGSPVSFVIHQPFLVFHLLSNRINIGILYGSPFFSFAYVSMCYVIHSIHMKIVTNHRNGNEEQGIGGEGEGETNIEPTIEMKKRENGFESKLPEWQ